MIYSETDILKIKRSCVLAKEVLDHVGQYVSIGISTAELDDICRERIIDHGAVPASLNYNGFPKSVCISVNHVVCHGIPGSYELRNGDIVNIDITVNKDGFFGDTSRTFLVGNVSCLAKNLTSIAEASMYIGIDVATPGNTLGDVGFCISEFVEKYGYSVVKDYCGHGIGMNFHESPIVLHYGKRGDKEIIEPGMVFTIEPMINVGSCKTKLTKDGWTVVTADGSLSAQFEHTIAITDDGNEILTM